MEKEITHIVIGDIHGRTNWKELIDVNKINIFVGDYFDPYEIYGFNELKSNFLEIIDYKKKYPNSILIILTTHTELSRNGYLVNAFRYIDKISLHQELVEAFTKVKSMFQRRETILLHQVSIGDIKVPIGDIIYIETEKRNILVHTKKTTCCCKENIQKVGGQLKEKGFCRPHRSYLVNMDWVEEVEKQGVILKTGETILVSGRRYSELKKEVYYWKFKYGNG